MPTAFTAPANPLEAFQWTPQPEAQSLVRGIVEDFLQKSPFAQALAESLRRDAGVRFIDLVDSMSVHRDAKFVSRLSSAGFTRQSTSGSADAFANDEGIFPSILLDPGNQTRMFLKVESVADFLATWQINDAAIEGAPLAPVRRAKVDATGNAELWVIERHGYRGFDVPEFSPVQGALVLKHQETFRRRQRTFAEDAQGFAHAGELVDAALADLGVDRTCDLFFAAEREYWQRRNRAGQIQKARQDRLGIGWANHDHHTYRSSREHFAALIGLFEKLGFRCRERFYAGGQAGWGAQIVEQPVSGITIFADVDMSPDELYSDFAHEGLPPRHQLGTVGLWCALHGEAFLQAGMHHLECQFDFSALKTQLESDEGVRVMKPFTDFPYLRQAFTEGEVWPVAPARVERLRQAGRITDAQAKQFLEKGALGSHLENLERNDGFKGFNQTGISEIITRTDPRAQHR